MIMEAEMSASGELHQESWWCDSSLKPAGLRCSNCWCFSLSAKAAKNPQCPSWKAVRQGQFPLTPGRVSLSVLFRLSTDWARLTHRGQAVCFTLCDSNVYLIQTHPESCLANCLHTMAQSHMKLAITVSTVNRGINQVPFKLIPSWTIREGFVKEVTIDIVDKY